MCGTRGTSGHQMDEPEICARRQKHFPNRNWNTKTFGEKSGSEKHLNLGSPRTNGFGHPDLANLGQSNFCQIQFLPNPIFAKSNFCQIQFLPNPIFANPIFAKSNFCQSMIWCVCHGGAKGWDPHPKKFRPRRVEGPIFSLYHFHFRFFFLSLS